MLSLLDMKSLSSFLLQKCRGEGLNKQTENGLTSRDRGDEGRLECGGYNEAFILERWAHYECPEDQIR